jgi:predicted RNA-binding protein
VNPEEKMCLSTVYLDSGNEQKEIMKDVARIEAEGKGLWLINLFGEKTFIEGKIQTVNLTDGSFITLRKEENGTLFCL